MCFCLLMQDNKVRFLCTLLEKSSPRSALASDADANSCAGRPLSHFFFFFSPFKHCVASLEPRSALFPRWCSVEHGCICAQHNTTRLIHHFLCPHNQPLPIIDYRFSVSASLTVQNVPFWASCCEVGHTHTRSWSPPTRAPIGRNPVPNMADRTCCMPAGARRWRLPSSSHSVSHMAPLFHPPATRQIAFNLLLIIGLHHHAVIRHSTLPDRIKDTIFHKRRGCGLAASQPPGYNNNRLIN